jgi:hypothetical protein
MNIGFAVTVGPTALTVFAILITAFVAIFCGYNAVEFEKAEE